MFKFSTPANAFSFADRADKIHMVIMGDDGKFWVCRPADAEALHAAGFEYAAR